MSESLNYNWNTHIDINIQNWYLTVLQNNALNTCMYLNIFYHLKQFDCFLKNILNKFLADFTSTYCKKYENYLGVGKITALRPEVSFNAK